MVLELEGENERLQLELEKERSKVVEAAQKTSYKAEEDHKDSQENDGDAIKGIGVRFELSKTKKELLKLQKENERLKEMLIKKESNEIAKTKDVIELEERLNILESQIQECNESRVKVIRDVYELQECYTKVLKRIKEAEEVYEMCTNFLQQNGILASSFLSASDNLF
eukprot:TRINITY_DN9452_c0_g1_i2.p1 TRINITY_DN9452_c0_g1~~TRINITY_DN9452_c0_g1_i2.p1  ORF type:complete len:168 (+),score=64.08 TRINITY_DN9452_c0_g1_i2:257-760(+)